MPDMTIETAVTCQTNVAWKRVVVGSGKKLWTVRWERQYTGPVQYNWSCDCPGFRFRKTCRHINDAKHLRCGWGSTLDERASALETNQGEPRCPQCSGPVEFIQVGV